MAKQKEGKTATDSGEKPKQTKIAAEDLPRRPLNDAVAVAEVLNRTYAGGPTSWDDLADALKIGRATNSTKYLFWAAIAYAIVKRDADKKFGLAETGRKIVAPTYDGEAQEGRTKAVLTPNLLSRFYTDYNGHLLPSHDLFPNVLERKYDIPRDRVEEAASVIVANAEYAGLLRKDGERQFISLEGVSTVVTPAEITPLDETGSPRGYALAATPGEWESICFYITPIGEDGTDIRKHSDMMLRHLIEPVLSPLGLKVVRADKIEKAGLITQQVFEHLVFARLCVADLSFGNPNAFYELGIRHFCMLPTVQVIRKGDKVPFDVSQGRTITVDTSDVYTVMDKFDSARKELAEHVKNCLQTKSGTPGEDNPLITYLPGIKVSLPKP